MRALGRKSAARDFGPPISGAHGLPRSIAAPASISRWRGRVRILAIIVDRLERLTAEPIS